MRRRTSWLVGILMVADRGRLARGGADCVGAARLGTRGQGVSFDGVPALVLAEPEGTVLHSLEGWVKAEAPATVEKVAINAVMAGCRPEYLPVVLAAVEAEHARTFERDGYTKADVRARIQDVTARPVREILPDDACEKGTSLKALPSDWLDPDGHATAAALDQPVPKFNRPENILIVVAGGTAGKFSAVVGGWASGAAGSMAVTREVRVPGRGGNSVRPSA